MDDIDAERAAWAKEEALLKSKLSSTEAAAGKYKGELAELKTKVEELEKTATKAVNSTRYWTKKWLGTRLCKDKVEEQQEKLKTKIAELELETKQYREIEEIVKRNDKKAMAPKHTA